MIRSRVPQLLVEFMYVWGVPFCYEAVMDGFVVQRVAEHMSCIRMHTYFSRSATGPEIR